MENNIYISIIGIIIFYALMALLYRYANGKWNVPENKKSNYQNWLDKYGKTLRKSLIILMVIYGISMLIQIIDQLQNM